MTKTVLSLQSHVACGHVGNSAAVFALQRLGIEVWPVHTVHFSNHPGRGAHRGRRAEAAEITDIVAGLDALGALTGCDAVITGYVADGAGARAVTEAAALARERNPKALICCDPVMGDTENGYFVEEDIRDHFLGGGLKDADMVVPNGFELAALSGGTVISPIAALAACDVLRARGPRTVIATGLSFRETEISTLTVTPAGAWQVTTPFVDLGRRSDGAGDLFAALFLGHILLGKKSPDALAHAVASTHGVLRATLQSGSEELALIAAQDEIAAPTARFEANRLRESTIRPNGVI